MAIKHTVVRVDDMDYNRVVSLKYHVDTTPTALENGRVVLLDSLMTGEREIYKAVTPAANTPLDKIAWVATPELMYDERLHNLDEFTNEADEVARGYVFNHGCYFSATKDAFTGTPAVGSIVELQADTKLKIVATATASATQVGRIVALETVGSYEYVVVRVEL